MPDHLTTEELEQYTLGQMVGYDLARVKEHLEWCLECADLAMAVERFIARVRKAAERGGYALSDQHWCSRI